MVVEDDIDIITVIRLALNKAGYSVTAAYDGLEALDKLEIDRPDIILLDIMLPKMDGIAFNAKIKGKKETSGIPVIVITGKGIKKDLVKMKESGEISDYLEKPFQLSALVDKIKVFI